MRVNKKKTGETERETEVELHAKIGSNFLSNLEADVIELRRFNDQDARDEMQYHVENLIWDALQYCDIKNIKLSNRFLHFAKGN